MGKQTFNQTKNILGILLVFFCSNSNSSGNKRGCIPSQQQWTAIIQYRAISQTALPKDTVFCLNLPTGIYHYKGQRWYGNTKSVAYVCQKEADQAGDRATRVQ